MAIKTFSTGEILTASDTNTYLANSGLVYVAKATLASNITDLVGCFTSTYDNYRIVIDSVSMSSAGDIYWRMLNGTTPITTADYNYYTTGILETGVVTTATGSGQTMAYSGCTLTLGGLVLGNLTFDFMGPNLNQRTLAQSQAIGYYGQFGNRGGGNGYNVVAPYTGIRFLTATATTFSGNVTVYGYRKG